VERSKSEFALPLSTLKSLRGRARGAGEVLKVGGGSFVGKVNFDVNILDQSNSTNIN
jgi:hypothetical protein